MFVSRVFGNLVFPRVFLTPDGGDGNGGGDGDPVDPVDPGDGGDSGDEPTLTKKEYEEQLSRMRQEMSRKNKKSLAEKEKEMGALKAEMAEMQEQLEKLKPRPDDPEDQLEEIRKRHKLEIEGIKLQLEEERKRRERADQERRESERDAQLRGSLADAKCHDQTVGYRYLLPLIEYDDYDDGKGPRWRIRGPKDLLMDITAENVKDLLPDYLLQSELPGGGSNSRGGSPSYSRKATELEEERKKLDALQKRAQSTGETQHILEFQRQARVVKQREAELEKSTK